MEEILLKSDLLTPYIHHNPMGGEFTRQKFTPLGQRLFDNSVYNKEESISVMYMSNDCKEITWNDYHIKFRVIDDGDCFSAMEYEVTIKNLREEKSKNNRFNILKLLGKQ